MQYFDLSDN